MKLKNQVVIVTGAGRGIGKAIAQRCAAEGAKVALVARTESTLQEVADEIHDAGGIALVLPADVSDQVAVVAMVERAEQTLGPIDLLVNNAYRMDDIGPTWAVDAADWCTTIAVDLQGVFFGCYAVLPGMVNRRRGRVINLVGGGMDCPFPFASSYAVSKAGVMRLTECLAAELVGTDVIAIALDPGLVLTPGMEAFLEREVAERWMPLTQQMFDDDVDVPPSLAAEFVVEIGTGRFDELAGRALFTADDLSTLEENSERIVAEDLYTLRMKRLDGCELNPILHLGGRL